MRRALLVALATLVVAPLGLMAWLSLRLAEGERDVVARRVEEVLRGRLRGYADQVARRIEARGEALWAVAGLGEAAMAEAARRDPFVAQGFVLGPDGKLRWPDPEAPATNRERAFLERTARLWQLGERFGRPTDVASTPAEGRGWHTWFYGAGANVIAWRRSAGGAVQGVEVDRMRLLSEVVGALPDTAVVRPEPGDARVVLRDAPGAVLYQFGDYAPAQGEAPRASLPLDPPLEAWRLEYFAGLHDLDRALGASPWRSVGPGLGALALALGGLALWFWREHDRAMRDALQRVGFVNQVSHELKTPLTNIRMYAELLEGEVGEGGKANQYLDVIISESQRLSRLIGNVLTFARQGRGAVEPRRRPAVADEVLQGVLAQFRPALEGKGLHVEAVFGAPGRVLLDADALDQIVANLVSNVEKYAAAGGLLMVCTKREGGRLTVDVEDRGPGVPAALAERVFDPFYRASDAVTDGVAGAGLGLTIARELARRHGGDLVLRPSDGGARFRLTLEAPEVTA